MKLFFLTVSFFTWYVTALGIPRPIPISYESAFDAMVYLVMDELSIK